jgi:hypothetical protein
MHSSATAEVEPHPSPPIMITVHRACGNDATHLRWQQDHDLTMPINSMAGHEQSFILVPHTQWSKPHTQPMRAWESK